MRLSNCLWIVLCQSFIASLSNAVHPKCVPSPCKNNGKCYFDPNVNNAKCICPTGYNGNYCQNSDPCAGGKCQNAGMCVPVVTMAATTYRCDCLPGFTGQHCEKAVSHCDKNPCAHGACVDLGTSYVCDCHPGYTGALCDKAASMCSTSPCNGVDPKARCTSETDGYSCQCSSYDYFGLNCESSSLECDKEEDSYCLCMVNNLPTKISIPTPKPYVGADTRDIMAGITGILLGWLLGTALFALYHCWCASGGSAGGWYYGNGTSRKRKDKPWERPSSNSSVSTVSSGLSSRPSSVNQIHPTLHAAKKGETRNMNIYRTGFVDDMTHVISVRKSHSTYQSGNVDW